MTLIQYFILFATVLLGGGAAFYFQKEKKGLLQLVLAFSGAYILGITVLHLMPWVYGSGSHEVGLWVLAGFFMQILLEQLSVGVEHGHIHAPHKHSKRFVLSVMLGLCIHAFVEGIPLSYYGEFHEAEMGGGHTHNHLFYGIMLHHIPAAFALVILLQLSQLKKSGVWLCLAIFAAMTPLGAAVAGVTAIDPAFQRAILAFAVGSLLHISTVILFEMDNQSHHYISKTKLAAIVAGFGLSLLTLL